MYSNLLKELHIDCKKCSGLCCVALYCSKVDGFPEDKPANTPCKHLQSNFTCDIHAQLFEKNLKGCSIYECFGAGQQVTQMYMAEGDWSTNPGRRKEIYGVFLTITQLYQIRWYLIQALNINASLELNKEISLLIVENEQIANQEPCRLLNYDLCTYRKKANNILRLITEQISKFPVKKNENFLGRNFKTQNLDGRDFSMALMIASNLENCTLRGANFLGADMRDCNIKNTDLSESLFLTQMQINSAKGNYATKLPLYLSRPSSWN